MASSASLATPIRTPMRTVLNFGQRLEVVEGSRDVVADLAIRGGSSALTSRQQLLVGLAPVDVRGERHLAVGSEPYGKVSGVLHQPVTLVQEHHGRMRPRRSRVWRETRSLRQPVVSQRSGRVVGRSPPAWGPPYASVPPRVGSQAQPVAASRLNCLLSARPWDWYVEPMAGP